MNVKNIIAFESLLNYDNKRTINIFYYKKKMKNLAKTID